MTTPTFFEQTGFTVRLESPLWISDSWGALEYRRNINSYTQQLTALGGYWQATVSLEMTREEAEALYYRALGRHVSIFDNFGQFFEGLLNLLTIQLGGLTVVRGPYMGIANHVRCLYSVLNVDDPDNIYGTREITAVAEDLESQAKYGIMQLILSVGGASEGNPEQIRDNFLEDYKEPISTSTLVFGANEPVNVTFEIIGYSQLLQTYVLENTSTGQQDSDAKIQYILTANPNSIFSTDYTNIDSNTTQVGVYENDYRVAWEVLKETVAKGDASLNRWIFGVYNDRVATFQQIPLSVEYQYKLAEKQQIILSDQGRVFPWRVLPGRWLEVSDFLPGAQVIVNPASISDLRKNPRMIFIETVNYSSPNSINLVGTQVGRTSQLLAQLGLGGVG